MKFKIIKHFALDFLGEEWKDCFIDFRPLTIADVKERLPQIAKLQEVDANSSDGIDVLVALLKEKFITGKAVGEDGSIIEIKQADLIELPVELIGKAFSFLSSGGELPS